MEEKATCVKLGSIRPALIRIKGAREAKSGSKITLSEIIREKLLSDQEVKDNIKPEDEGKE